MFDVGMVIEWLPQGTVGTVKCVEVYQILEIGLMLL